MKYFVCTGQCTASVLRENRWLGKCEQYKGERKAERAGHLIVSSSVNKLPNVSCVFLFCASYNHFHLQVVGVCDYG